MSAFASVAANEITARQVHDTIARHMLADGFAFVLDIDASRGSQLVDARTGTSYLDLFTFFASSALGMNHPSLAGDAAFRDELARVAVNKPSNSDVYSVPVARSPSRTRSRSPSTGRADGTRRTASTRHWARGCSICRTRSTDAPATRCR